MGPAKQSIQLLSPTRQIVCRVGRFYSTAAEPPKQTTEVEEKPKSARLVEFEKKLRAKTPLGKLEEHSVHPYQEKEPLKPWPNNTNPSTGEVGGPAGPEPTRYGDWERKGRVSDF